MTKRYAVIAFLVVAMSLFFGLHFGVLGANQGGTAHGEQGATIALAEGFIQNNLDFFHPQTRALNYKNGDFDLQSTGSSGITAVHFPIHTYIPAVISKVTSTNLNVILQWYNLLWGFVGLYFIYLLSLRLTNNIGKSLFVVLFVGTAPLFAFYQSNFLVEIPSFSALLIGVYCIYVFHKEGTYKFAWIGLGFIAFSSLTSPNFLLYLIGASLFVLYQLRSQSNLKVRFICYILLFYIPVALNAYWFYWLKSAYGSQFASIFQDWTYDQSVSNSLFGSWKMHYFTIFQTVVISIVLIIFVVQLARSNREDIKLDWRRYRIALIAVPAIVFLIVSPYQSFYSDIFLLKFGGLAIIFALIFMVDHLAISWVYRYPKIGTAGFILLLFILLSEGNWTQNVRHEKNRTSSGTNLAFTFRGGDELLLKHGVKQSDTLNVVVPENWGIGQEVLGYLNHAGIIREIPSNKRSAARFPKGHYVVCHIDERPHLYAHFRTNFKELGDNGSIVLFKAID